MSFWQSNNWVKLAPGVDAGRKLQVRAFPPGTRTLYSSFAYSVLGFYRQIRMRYDPRLRIYLVADNLSTHKTPAIREWAATSNVELVFTPTYASFLNRIECHVWAIGEFVIKNADYPDWDTLARHGIPVVTTPVPLGGDIE